MRLVRPFAFLSAALLLTLPGCGRSDEAESTAEVETSTVPAPDSPEVMALVQVANKYKDVNVALSEGYIPADGMCVTAAMEGLPGELGGMGVHYIRPDLLKITAVTPRVNGMSTHTDFMQPGILIYEPTADGQMELVAIESLVFTKSWHDAGNTTPPNYEGVEYNHMLDNPATPGDEAHGFEEHYDLHAWVAGRENPAGMFEPFNPAITCQNPVPASVVVPPPPPAPPAGN